MQVIATKAVFDFRFLLMDWIRCKTSTTSRCLIHFVIVSLWPSNMILLDFTLSVLCMCAPLSTSRATTATSPLRHPKWSGVQPLTINVLHANSTIIVPVAVMSAPRSNNKPAVEARPCMLAWCKGVQPCYININTFCYETQCLGCARRWRSTSDCYDCTSPYLLCQRQLLCRSSLQWRPHCFLFPKRCEVVLVGLDLPHGFDWRRWDLRLSIQSALTSHLSQQVPTDL